MREEQQILTRQITCMNYKSDREHRQVNNFISERTVGVRRSESELQIEVNPIRCQLYRPP